MKNPPVITIDGPSGVGKGTVANRLAQVLGWHFLDSGAMYRLLALQVFRVGLGLLPALNNDLSALDNRQKQDLPLQLATMAKNLDIRFQYQRCYLDDQDVTDAIRQEDIGLIASKISAFPEVRQALLERQRAFAKAPGLVTDGRDMGSVVFPQATIKFYLDADAEIRARRRELQLKERGIDVIFGDLLEDIKKRDQQDKSRAIAPLVVPEGAIVIDTGTLNKDQVFEKMMAEVRCRVNVGGS